MSSTRRPRRLTLRRTETPDATVPQLPPATTSSGGDLSNAAAVTLPSPSLPPPPPPTPTTMTATRSRGRGRVMFEQLIALNSANAIIDAQATANQPESEVGVRFGSNIVAFNTSRPTRSLTSGSSTCVTSDRVKDWEAQTQEEAKAESNLSLFPSPRHGDNVVLNFDRGASQTSSPLSSDVPTRSLRLRPLRMTSVSAAENEAAITAIVVQSEARRRTRNNTPLSPEAQWLLEAGSAAPSSTGRRTRSASAAAGAAITAVAANVMTSSSTAVGGRSEKVALNLGGNGSTRQQSAPYYHAQRATRARSTLVNNEDSHHVSEASSPRPPTSFPSTTTAADAAAAGPAPTPSRGAASAGTKRSRTEMEMPGDNNIPLDAGHAGGAVSGGPSPGAGHSSSGEEPGGVTQTGEEDVSRVEEAPQSTQAGSATQIEEPAFAVTLSVHPTTGVPTYTFLLPPGVDPNHPLGFDGVINILQLAGSADTAVGSSASATPPSDRTSMVPSSPSAVSPNGLGATATLSGGVPAARTAVLQAAISMIENLGTTDAIPIIPCTTTTTTTTTATVASAGHEATFPDDIAPSSVSSNDPISPHHDDDGSNGGSPFDLSLSSSEYSAGQDGGEDREKRRRIDDRDEDSSVV
ncbi:hypothetical protein BGZ90_004447 [Linnemannia elongata]|nr:hypothetical protein BGZ90_004447 [Linnemannia elongata]